jgi:hypothetical protein
MEVAMSDPNLESERIKDDKKLGYIERRFQNGRTND